MSKKKPHNVNFWEMLRDVLSAGVNKGQVPQVTLAIVCIAIILKMPGADVTKLVNRLLDGMQVKYYLGWILCFVAVFGWGWHAKYQRSVCEKELRRVSKERNKYQRENIKGPIKSSKEA